VADVRMIANTTEPMRHPWPDDVYVQGGARGVVLHRDGTHYRTAFVEAFPRNSDTFLRGEGKVVEEAETACWEQYQQMADCPTHPTHGPFEARGFTDGAGFCTHCGTWFSRVLPPGPADPNRQPSFMERALSGDPQAVAKVITAMADVEDEASRG